MAKSWLGNRLGLPAVGQSQLHIHLGGRSEIRRPLNLGASQSAIGRLSSLWHVQGARAAVGIVLLPHGWYGCKSQARSRKSRRVDLGRNRKVKRSRGVTRSHRIRGKVSFGLSAKEAFRDAVSSFRVRSLAGLGLLALSFCRYAEVQGSRSTTWYRVFSSSSTPLPHHSRSWLHEIPLSRKRFRKSFPSMRWLRRYP